MLVRRSPRTDGRRGAVMLVVLGLLTLFTTLGLSFAILAKVEGQGARNFKRIAQGLGGGGAVSGPAAVQDRRQLMTFAIQQLIYDTHDTRSALRGHSLLRDMYGSPVAVRFQNYPNYNQRRDGADPEADAGGYRGAFNGPGLLLPSRWTDRTDPTADDDGNGTPDVYDPIAFDDPAGNYRSYENVRDFLKLQRNLSFASGNSTGSRTDLDFLTSGDDNDRSGTERVYGFTVDRPDYPLNFTHYRNDLGAGAVNRLTENTNVERLRHPEMLFCRRQQPALHSRRRRLRRPRLQQHVPGVGESRRTDSDSVVLSPLSDS